MVYRGYSDLIRPKPSNLVVCARLALVQEGPFRTERSTGGKAVSRRTGTTDGATRVNNSALATILFGIPT